MTAFQSRPAASATALLVALGAALAAGSAQAAVTAQQVWDDWKSNMDMSAGSGLTIGSEELAGGVLTVTDLAYNSTGEDGTTLSVTVPQITLTENGDGTVSVALPASVPVALSSPADPAAGTSATEVALEVTQTGMTLTVSGDPGALTYEQAASRLALELLSLAEDGVEQPAEMLVALNDLSGTTTSTTAETRRVAYDVAVGSLDLLVNLASQEDGSGLALSGQVQTVAVNADLALPLTMAESPDTALMDGLTATGGYTSGPAQYTFEITDPAGPTSGTVATGGGEATFDVSREAIGYDASARGIQVDATSAQTPFPISVSLAEYGVNALIPASKADAPADWALGVNLSDLAINEEVWALFDPQGMLAHDPATLIVDLSGTATLLFDLFDPAQEEAMNAAPVPGEINSVSLNDLNVSVGGAQVTGTGAFTLDNTDTTTFPGIPRPEGSAEFQLNGINALIDDLVAMGLIPQEQVMGARMFLGLLAVPVGDDQLTSRIEVTADGQLLANGQRLQ